MSNLHQDSMFDEIQLSDDPAPYTYKAIIVEQLSLDDHSRRILLLQCNYEYLTGAKCKGEFLVYRHHLMGGTPRKQFFVHCNMCLHRWIYNHRMYVMAKRDPLVVKEDAIAFLGHKMLFEDSARSGRIWIAREYNKIDHRRVK